MTFTAPPDWWIRENKKRKEDIKYQSDYYQMWQIFMWVYNGLGLETEAKTLARYWNRHEVLPPDLPTEFIPKKQSGGVMQVDGVGEVIGAMQI